MEGLLVGYTPNKRSESYILATCSPLRYLGSEHLLFLLGMTLSHEDTVLKGTLPPITKFGGNLSISIDLNVLVSLGLAVV